MHAVLAAAAAVAGLALGHPLAGLTLRLADTYRAPVAGSAPVTDPPLADPTVHGPGVVPSRGRVVATGLLAAAAMAGAVAVTGVRPMTVGVVAAAAAAVLLGGVDLLVHRLPDRVTGPAVLVVLGALLLDGAVTGQWPAVLRAVLAGAVAAGGAAALWLAVPRGLGLGDAKLLGLLGPVLGWRGWDVLLAGVFLGLLVGALLSLGLLATRRAGWRTAVPFGPPLLIGAALALAAAGPS